MEKQWGCSAENKKQRDSPVFLRASCTERMIQMKLQILVADSVGRSTDNLNNLFTVLEESEYAISRCTTDLNEAVSLVHEHRFDILICVNRAPEYIAAKLLRLTGTSEMQIPTVIISDQDDSQRMRECFLLGAVDFLSEPVPPEDFIAALNRASTLIQGQLIESEYRMALEQAIGSLPQAESLQATVEKLRTFLLKMSQQTATVELAADYFGFNRDYFGRYFKSKFEITFGEFYKNFQIDYAKRLLETGQFKVLEVSKQLGFATPDYFTRVFKKRTGMIPSAMKR